ncbi:uncharacterized mitochondrial protein-like protein, partial [Tanacetum coccineum]
AAVQNSNSSAQQDTLILSVIEQLKTQVINYTKINLDNKSVNDTLTTELERYKEQVNVLKEGQNVDLKSRDNVSDSCEQSVEIDHLKQILSEQLKEKESLMQTVTLLKNDFKKEESRNIDREIALEKKIKKLDNIVYKRDQSTQSVHMLTKPIFYNHTTKQALGFQNPFYLKKAQQLEPKRMMNSMNSSDPIPSCRPTKVEVPKELPKVSMCLKLENELLNKKDFIEKVTYDKLFRSYTTLEKHCISLEVDTQLNLEIFQKGNSVSNQSAPNFDKYFELNELKAQSQEKDTVIKKLKEKIKSLSGNMNKDKIKKDIEEIETINITLEHRCNGCMLSDSHDLCVLNFINDMNARAKSKSVKKSSKRKVCKPTARHGLVRCLPKLNFEKDHLCSTCAMGKSKKKPYKPKSEDTNQEKLYLLHMDLCGLMCVASVNGKKYIFIIVGDYSRFTWVKCLISIDEALEFIIKFLKMIQLRLKAPVRRIKTDNGTEIVNQTLREYYEKVGISHETSVARSP